MTKRTELAAIWPPTAAVSREADHKPMSPLKAIREKCRGCSGGSLAEVRRCEAVSCALWPFRAGTHPWHSLSRKTGGKPAGFGQAEAFHEGPAGRFLDAHPAQRAEP
jgi:hypothetical protein